MNYSLAYSGKTLSINKDSAGNLLILITVLSLIGNALIDMLKLPSSIRYFADVLLLTVVVYLFYDYNYFKQFRIDKSISISVYLFMIYSILSSILYFVPMGLSLWAFRNVNRFLIFILACAYLWDESHITKLVKILYFLFSINVGLSLIQKYFLGLSQDNLGGIFGTQQGSNAYSNIFFCIMASLSICEFMNKKCSLHKLIYIIASVIILSALAEIKIVYIELAIIILMIPMLNKTSIKSIIITASAIIAILLGVELLKQNFPDQLKYFADKDSLIEYATMKGGGYNISRFNAFSEIDQLFFHGNVFKNLFGLGFGHCEYSQFEFLISDFYKENGSLNYRWFMHQMTFLEIGYIGVISYLSVFFLILLKAIRMKSTVKNEYLHYVNFTIMMFPITIINFVYNSSLRNEAAYILFAILSPVLILTRQIRE